MSKNSVASVLNKSARIQYIDALRGFTMVLVVFAHVEAFGFFNFGYETLVGKLFQSFRMPLFFFISGFLAYKAERVWDINECWQLTRKKFVVLIVPTLIFGLIYTFFYVQGDLYDFLSNPTKLGYWFTLVLFEILLLYYFLSGLTYALSKRINVSEASMSALLLISFAVGLLMLKLPFKIIPCLDMLGNYSSLHFTFGYFMYFVFGVIARQYMDRFERMIDNKWITAIAIVVFAGVFLWYSQLDITLYRNVVWVKVVQTIVESIMGFVGIVVVFAFFRKHSSSFENTTKLGNALQYIGRRTLDIYVLHYFFLPNIPCVGDFLKTSNNVILELFAGIILSLMIIVVCLGLSNVVRVNPILRKYLFGTRE